MASSCLAEEAVFLRRGGGGGVFEGTPVVMVLLLATLLLFVLNGSALGLPAALSFAENGELLVGILILYRCREVERLQGSRRTASQVILATVFQLVVAVALEAKRPGFRLAGGPYAAIFSLVTCAAFTVPSSASVRVFGIVEVSNTSLLHLGALHLMLSRGTMSVASAACGIVSQTLLPSWITLPDFVARACQNSIGRLLEGPNARKAKVRYGRFVQSQRASLAVPSTGDGPSSRSSSAAAAAADPQALQTLEGMGFDRQMAAQALAHAHNDLQLAMNLLLGQQ